MTDYSIILANINQVLQEMTQLHSSISINDLCVRGLSSNPDPRAMKLLTEHPDLRESLYSYKNRIHCRHNLAKNSIKEAMHIFDIMTGSEEDAPLLCANPSKPAIMLLMNREKKYKKFMDLNALYNNQNELAQWWVSIKKKSTPNLFKDCKISVPVVDENTEVDLYTLAAREDADALVIIESFITGSWLSWFEENSKMKPIVEREWSATREDRKFWQLLCANRNPQIFKFLFIMKEYIDWESLSANPSIFAKVE